MSDEVDVLTYGAITLEPGETARFGHNSPFFTRYRTMQLATSPDNFPSSIEITRRWSYTDQNQIIWMAAEYHNNGSNTVVFRPKAFRAPPFDLIVTG